MSHNPQKTLPGFTEEEGDTCFQGITILAAKVGNATSKLVSGPLYISYLFSLMFYTFSCQKQYGSVPCFNVAVVQH